MSHSIRLPGTLLDELKDQDYSKDSRFKTGKKRKTEVVSRKDKRKQQRLEKRIKSSKGAVKAPVINKVKQVKEKLTKPKVVQKQQNTQSKSELPWGDDDELDSDDFDEFDEDDLDEEEWAQLKELEGEEEESEEEVSVHQTMAALKAKKVNKGKVDKEMEKEIAAEEKRAFNKAQKLADAIKNGEEDSNESEDEFDLDEEMTVEETMAALKDKKAKVEEESEDSGLEEEMNDGIEEDDFDSDEEEEEKEMTVEETMAALKAAKAKKNAPQQPAEESESESENSGLDEEMNDGIDEDDFDSDEEEEEKEMTVEETMAALKAAKAKKKSSKAKKEPEPEVYDLPPQERAAFEKDEMDMLYYAKKLGLKGKKKLSKRDEDDVIGGLLEGLDFFDNYGDENEDYGDLELGDKEAAQSESEEELEGDEFEEPSEEEEPSDNEEENGDEMIENPFSEDDELNSSDFDEFGSEDLDEEELEQLRELEGKSASSKKKEKENPYVAPGSSKAATARSTLTADNAVTAELRKKIRSSLNKLSEGNVTSIIASLNSLYDSNPRQYVTDVLTSLMIEIVGQPNKLLDSFIAVYAGVAFALWKLRGMEVGATFVQSVVEAFLAEKSINILTLLAYTYNFGVVSSRLVYDIVRSLVGDFNEHNTELLLRIISVSGSMIRADDPMALKDIIGDLLKSTAAAGATSARTKFLIETINNLKNNKLKPSVQAMNITNLKKVIVNSVGASKSDPLQVSLDDIKSIDTKGKWWLVGASWKGDTSTSVVAESATSTTKFDLKDDLLDAVPDWSEMAKQQRMNTDIRRAIFISIMSAQDFMDAFTQIEKLNLKNKQMLEFPKVLLHCLNMESTYNPYYALLATKISEYNHQLAKSFQFAFWDFIKRFEDDYEGESSSDIHIVNDARFFGHLIAHGVMKLDVLKHFTFTSSEGHLFLELMFFQIFVILGKKQDTAKLQSMFSVEDENGVVLKSLGWFFKKFKYTASNKKEEKRVEWCLGVVRSLL